MEAGGDPSLPTTWNRRSTALRYARQKQDKKLLDLLQPQWQVEQEVGADGFAAAHPSSPPPAAQEKRVRRATPIAERAERAGVSKRLKPLPNPLPESASQEEVHAHKEEVKRIQTLHGKCVLSVFETGRKTLSF